MDFLRGSTARERCPCEVALRDGVTVSGATLTPSAMHCLVRSAHDTFSHIEVAKDKLRDIRSNERAVRRVPQDPPSGNQAKCS